MCRITYTHNVRVQYDKCMNQPSERWYVSSEGIPTT